MPLTEVIIMVFAAPWDATFAMYIMEQQGMLYSTFQILGSDAFGIFPGFPLQPSQGYPQGWGSPAHGRARARIAPAPSLPHMGACPQKSCMLFEVRFRIRLTTARDRNLQFWGRRPTLFFSILSSGFVFLEISSSV